MGNCTLVLQSNVDCDVFVDGEYEAMLWANIVEKISIPAGQHILEFKATVNQITGSTEDEAFDNYYRVSRVIDAPSDGSLAIIEEGLKRQYDADVKELSDQIEWPDELFDAIARLNQKIIDENT